MPDALPAPTALSAATGPLALVPGDRPWAVLVDRIRGVVTSAEELDAYLATVTAALRDGIAGCDDAVLTRDETAERPEDPEERSPALEVFHYARSTAVAAALGSRDPCPCCRFPGVR